MKLSEYKQLLDLKVSMESAARDYFRKSGVEITSIKAVDMHPTFTVFQYSTGKGPDQVQALSPWTFVEDGNTGCTTCGKSPFHPKG